MKSISVSETAKLIRLSLKAQFKDVKFSVRSKSYAGGASINIEWIDGVDKKEVEKVIAGFEGADFDGMQDLKTYKYGELNGEKVRFGADFIFCNRDYSDTYLSQTAAKTVEYWGLTITASEFVERYKNGNLWDLGKTMQPNNPHFLQDHFSRCLEHWEF